MESEAKTIKTQFAGAANALSEFFVGSVDLQKKAYICGKQDAFREVMSFCQGLENESQSFDVGSLKSFLDKKIAESEVPEEEEGPSNNTQIN